MKDGEGQIKKGLGEKSNWSHIFFFTTLAAKKSGCNWTTYDNRNLSHKVIQKFSYASLLYIGQLHFLT